MADVMKPEDAGIIGQIRKFEEELFKTHNFKLYRNYHVPEYHVMNSKRVLSFGIGADAHFEKLICVDNPGLDVRMFDPTPGTKVMIKQILSSGGKHYFKSIRKGYKKSQEIVDSCLKFYPVAYARTNGNLNFYPPNDYDTSLTYVRGKAEPIPASYSLIDTGNGQIPVIVPCKNITTIMTDLGWDSIDILKTDVEGLWYDIGQEIADLDVKFWVTEIELTIGMSIEQAFDEVRELYNLHQTQYNIYINRKRDKKMMELIFIRKDVDES